MSSEEEKRVRSVRLAGDRWISIGSILRPATERARAEYLRFTAQWPHRDIEPLGAIDSIATANEMALALLVFFHLRRERPGALMRGYTRLTTAAALCLILLSSLALMGGHAH